MINLWRSATIGVVMSLTPIAAHADEVWTTPVGEVIYEKDIGDTAIFLTTYSDEAERIYLPELAGMLDYRSTHWGYWIADRDGPCKAELTGPDGMTSTDWGRIMVAFDHSSFPTGWTAVIGQCFGEVESAVRAEAKVGTSP